MEIKTFNWKFAKKKFKSPVFPSCSANVARSAMAWREYWDVAGDVILSLLFVRFSVLSGISVDTLYRGCIGYKECVLSDRRCWWTREFYQPLDLQRVRKPNRPSRRLQKCAKDSSTTPEAMLKTGFCRNQISLGREKNLQTKNNTKSKVNMRRGRCPLYCATADFTSWRLMRFLTPKLRFFLISNRTVFPVRVRLVCDVLRFPPCAKRVHFVHKLQIPFNLYVMNNQL